MIHWIRWVSLVLALVLVWPVFAQTEKKDDKKSDKDTSKEKLVPFKSGITAKITNVNKEQRVLHVEVGKANFDVVASDNVKVQNVEPPPGFDEKGNFKKYTTKELAELKGAGPWYPAEFESLKPGQIVQLNLAKKATPAAKSKGKDEPPPDNRLRATYILIKKDVQ